MRTGNYHLGAAWRVCLAGFVCAIAAAQGAAGQQPPAPPEAAVLVPTPINEAEAIIEPFWEPVLSGLKHWSIRDGLRYGLEVKQTWASVEFYWSA